MNSVWRPTPDGQFHSLAVASNGEYGAPEGLQFGFPVRSTGDAWSVVEGLEHDDFAQDRIRITTEELVARARRGHVARPDRLVWTDPSLWRRFVRTGSSQVSTASTKRAGASSWGAWPMPSRIATSRSGGARLSACALLRCDEPVAVAEDQQPGTRAQRDREIAVEVADEVPEHRARGVGVGARGLGVCRRGRWRWPRTRRGCCGRARSGPRAPSRSVPSTMPSAPSWRARPAITRVPTRGNTIGESSHAWRHCGLPNTGLDRRVHEDQPLDEVGAQRPTTLTVIAATHRVAEDHARPELLERGDHEVGVALDGGVGADRARVAEAGEVERDHRSRCGGRRAPGRRAATTRCSRRGRARAGAARWPGCRVAVARGSHRRSRHGDAVEGADLDGSGGASPARIRRGSP